MEKDIVFRIHFIIAWPIWAGGYPTQKQALCTFEEHRNQLELLLQDRLIVLLSDDFVLTDLLVQIGSIGQIEGLGKSTDTPNTLNVFVVVKAPNLNLKRWYNLSDRIDNVVLDLEGYLTTFSRTYMLGGKQGANIYDVDSRWDPGPALSFVDSVEPLVESVAPPPPSQRNSIFVSYARKDHKWLLKLQIHLRPLERDFRINCWDDTEIEAGMNWKEEIKKGIQAAKVAILLVSPDFVASNFIFYNELPDLLIAAKDEGTLIIPVILSPSSFFTNETLSQFQAINPPSKPLKAMRAVQQDAVYVELTKRIQAHFSS